MHKGGFYVQYTIRNIPASIDRELRERSRRSNKSLNETVVDTLRSGLGIGPDQPAYDDLDDLIGTWKEDPDFDRAVAEQDMVDEALWR
jgi:plasmid stability protein